MTNGHCGENSSRRMAQGELLARRACLLAKCRSCMTCRTDLGSDQLRVAIIGSGFGATSNL